MLQAALKSAVREGMIVRNVAEIAEKPDYTPEEREPLTFDQAKQLLTVSEKLRDPLLSRWVAALFLGARQGELLGLQWSRVDLDNGVVDLAWQLQQLQQVHGCTTDSVPVGQAGPCGRKRPGYCPQRRLESAARV